jgi:hypothetical protein
MHLEVIIQSLIGESYAVSLQAMLWSEGLIISKSSSNYYQISII